MWYSYSKLADMQICLYVIKKQRHNDMSEWLYVYVQTCWIVYVQICLHEKVQTSRLFFITASLYADE